MKFRRPKRNIETHVDMTSMIDVMLVLLIFFMVASTFSKEAHLTITLPHANGQPEVQQQEPLDIIINRDGEYAINGRTLVNNRIETLKAALQETSGGNTDLPLIITADANTTHQSVVQDMDVAGQLGFVHLSISTKKVDDTGDH